MKFKQISISLGQQGGIGLLPRLVKIDRWYAISDSRTTRPSDFFWDNTENDRYHSQGWAYHRFLRLPQITQKEAEEKMRELTKEEKDEICTSCGGSFSDEELIRAKTVLCPKCGGLLDTTDSELKNLI